MQRIRLVYWAVTGLLALAMLGSGVGDVVRAAPIVQNMQHLGFPLSLVPFLGVMKILGALTVLFVSREHLKVGAYAGLLFYSLGAVMAHLGTGDPVAAALPALVLTGLTLASYRLWLASRARPAAPLYRTACGWRAAPARPRRWLRASRVHCPISRGSPAAGPFSP